MSDRKFIDPTKFKYDDLPLIVLSTHSSGLIQWLIKWRTKSNYNHAMVMIHPGEFASQGNTFSSVNIERYMTKYSRLKFFRIKDIGFSARQEFIDEVKKDLKASWWKRSYDYLGILGQAIGIKKINNPWTQYCSERVRKLLNFIMNLIGLIKNPSPEDLNIYMKQDDRFEVVGYWWEE